MIEQGPNNRWAIIRDIPADPGGVMAVVSEEIYIAPCRNHNPGIPVYTKHELKEIRMAPHSAQIFRMCQKVKKVFPTAEFRWEKKDH